LVSTTTLDATNDTILFFVLIFIAANDCLGLPCSIEKMKKPPLPSLESMSSPQWWSDAFVSEQADALCSVVAGAVTFGSTLALSTWTQWRILGIQTGTPGPAPYVICLSFLCVAL
jgi:hypothetical protein